MSDWNYAAETTLATGLQYVPEVGNVLSGLVNILWPEQENVWDEIKDQIEQIMDEKIDDLVYEDVQDSLAGLQDNLNQYTETVKSNDASVISDTWISVKTEFVGQQPNFQAK